MVIRVYVDSNHAGNVLNRRYHTGIIIYVNNALIIWFRKLQSTLELSSFWSELITLRITPEMVEWLRYKLRTFGIPIDGPDKVFCDNQLVVKN